MTSVNAMNAEQIGYRRGKRDGYDIGYEASNEMHKRERKILRRMRFIIYIVVALGIVFAWSTDTHAQTATTSLTVVIKQSVTAEVSCNPTNCPEIGIEEPLVIENTQGESIFSKLWSAILRALT